MCSPARARAGEGESILALYWPYIGSILALYWPYIGPILALYWPSPRPRRATAVSGADAPETGGIPPGPGPPLLARKGRRKAGGGGKPSPQGRGGSTRHAPAHRQRTAGVAASARIRQAEGWRGRTPAAGRSPAAGNAAGNARPKAGPIAPGQRPEQSGFYHGPDIWWKVPHVLHPYNGHAVAPGQMIIHPWDRISLIIQDADS